MATVYLGRSDEQFWCTTLRDLTILIEEWTRIEKLRRDDLAFRVACWNNGKNPNDFEKKAEAKQSMTPSKVFDML